MPEVDPGSLWLFPLAFVAGIISFLSPCVLPLVPGYLSYMSGVAASEDSPSARKTLPPALAFVLGFSAIFVPLGATASLLGSYLKSNQVLLTRVGGVFIILMGLFFIGLVKVPALQRERRLHVQAGGLGGSAVMGAAFAFGWSPCIGPILASVLALSTGAEVGRGALGLAFYSLGLGLPFIVAALGVARLTGAVKWLRRHTQTITLASGVLLIGAGLLFLTNSLFNLSIWIQKGFDAVGLDFLARI